VVELRHVGGWPLKQVAADVLGIPSKQAKDRWRLAQACPSTNPKSRGTPMDADFYGKLEGLFAQAADLPPEQRPAFLDRACAGDGAARAELESLLAARDRAEAQQFLGRPAAAGLALTDESEDDLVGQTVGPYTVEARLGGGGFGTVYRAARSDGQYHQAVALKVLNAGLGGGAVLARFRRERQALAGLESHPHIVTLFDAGLAPGGRPFFVMELVDGHPLDQYCDGLKLPVRERLRLFLQVCAAVQHAHQSLVLHRDLKPANILAGPGPGGGHAVKLLDFGIAKSLGPQPGEEGGAELTGPWERIFTPAYASPEQVRGGRVDVRSDVYSLGVLLYELLTGHRPYRVEGADAEAVVCSQEPERPSTKVGRSETVAGAGGATGELTPQAVSGLRSARPGQLRRQLAGDLDNIALKALAKEPGRRYQSVDELARDVRAYLDGEPVSARGNPWGYRAGKFARKHKGKLAAAAGALLLVALAAFRQAIKFQPKYALAHSNLGATLRDKGDLDGALAACRQALEFQPGLAHAHVRLGNVLRDKGDLDGAVAAFRQAIALQPRDAKAYNNLGNALRHKRDLDGAVAALRKAAALRPDFALIHLNLGAALRRQGRFVGSLQAYRRGHVLGSKQPGWRHPSGEWVREAERLVELDGKLGAFRKGKYWPEDNEKRLTLAAVCRARKLPFAAARLYADAFAAESRRAEYLAAGLRYKAACCAALAAGDQGEDAGTLDDKERPRWRKQALTWLRADLAAYAKLLGGGKAQDRALVREQLRDWQRDPDLLGLRHPAALAPLPADERQAWKKFWEDVTALLRRAEGQG
jgi:serine/threonine protein kinase/cytochrome c-type biogenesis protein CcmH/NrfG